MGQWSDVRNAGRGTVPSSGGCRCGGYEHDTGGCSCQGGGNAGDGVEPGDKHGSYPRLLQKYQRGGGS